MAKNELKKNHEMLEGFILAMCALSIPIALVLAFYFLLGI
jgi:hypothetical protein